MQNRRLKKAITKISQAGGAGVGKTSGRVKEGVGVRMKEERGGGGGVKTWALGLSHSNRVKTIGSYLDGIQTPGAVIRLR